MAKWKLLYVVTLMASLSFFGVNAFNEYKPTVMSDKDDYAPGEVAIITGYGWTQDEYVDVHFEETPAYHGEHQHDFHGIKVNADGTWTINYQIEERHFGVAFDVQVVGKQSGAEALTHFTDAHSVTGISPVSGSMGGGNTVTISGRGFVNLNTAQSSGNNWLVKFGNSNPVVATRVNNNNLTVITPPHVAGSVNVIVYPSNDIVDAVTSPVGFTFIDDRVTTSFANLSSQTIIYGTTSTTIAGKINANPLPVGNVNITINGVTNQAAISAVDGTFSTVFNTANFDVTNSPYEIHFAYAGSSSHKPISDNSRLLTVTKADQVITWEAPANIQYGTALSSKQLNAVVLGNASLTYTPALGSILDAGQRTLTVNVAETPNYKAATKSVTLVVDRAEQVITWEAPKAITYGTALSASELNATALGEAKLTFTPALGTTLNAGTHTLTVQAAATNNYNAASKEVQLVVNKADQVIAWEAPTTITYGTVLSSAQLNASALGNAVLTYAPAADTRLNAGQHVLTVTAAETNNYKAATKEVALTVNKATATLELSNLSHTYDGTAKSATATTVPANLDGVSISNNGKTDANTYEVEATLNNLNYTAAPVKGSLVIAPRALTVKANSKERQYNEANPSLDGEMTGSVLADNISATYSTSATQSSNVGEYAITATLVDPKNRLANYTVTNNPGTLKITPAAATITLADLTKTYNGKAQGATVTTAPAGLAVRVSYDGASAVPTAANSYKVVAVLANSNYMADNATGTLVINKAVLSIKANDATKTYGEENPALVASIVSGIQNDETFKLTASTVAGVNSAVNTYAITPSVDGATLDNYTVTASNGTLTVRRKELIAKADDKSRAYGEENPALTISYTGFVLGEDATALTTAPTASTAATATSAVADYAITVAGGEAANYSFKYVPGTLKVGKAALTVTAKNESRVYGEKNPAFTGTVEGAKNGETFTVGGTSDATVTAAVGTYDIVPTVSGTTINNYTVAAVNGKLAVTAREITVTAAAKQSKVYGDANPEAYAYAITTGSLANNDELTGALTRDAGENVGDYAITQGTLAATTNYILRYVGDNFSISQRPIEVTADAKTKVYGDKDPALTYRITNGSLVKSDALTGELKRATGEGVGAYAIAQNSLTAGANYAMTFVPADLQITPKAIVVTPRSNQSKVFGAADPVLAYDNTPLVNGDAFTGALKRAEGEDVGPYAITIGSLKLSNNYTLSLAEGVEFNITPMQITASITASNKVYDGTDAATATGSAKGVNNADVAVTVSKAKFENARAGEGKAVTATVAISNPNYILSSATASTKADITPKGITGTFVAANKVYDGNNAATVSSRSLEGVIGEDKVALAGGAATFADKHAATGKTVTLAGAELAGDDKGNYRLTEVATAKADITPKAASVTPLANTKVYGGAEPELAGDMSGFLAEDKITASFVRTPGQAVATYTISALLSPEAALANYAITYNTAKFVITPATITVVAADKSRVYGEANPALTGTVEGIVAEDKIAVSFATKATAASNVGTYAIEPQVSGDALSNYVVKATNGTLTVTPASLTVLANNKTRIYGVANPVLDGTLTGVMNDDPITATYSTLADENSNVGPYAITVELNDPKNRLSNYEVSKTGATLTITQAPATITIADLNKVYNGKAQGATVTTSPAGLAVRVSYDGASAVPTAANSYKVVAVLANSNYMADNATATLVIAPKEVSAVLANAGKIYDRTTAAPGTTATLTGVLDADDVKAEVAEAVFSSANAGLRTVTAKVTLVGKDNGNYLLGDVSAATATISPKAVTAAIVAAGKVYDGTTAAPGTTATLAGVISPDKVTTTVSDAVYSDANAGTRTVTAKVELAGDDKANYTLQAVTPANATISPRAITVAADAKSKVYGDNDPALTFTLKGSLVQGENFSGELKRVAGENVGAYAINLNTLTAGDNYALTYETADLKITAKAITITADAKSKTYGDSDQALTYSITTGALVGKDAFSGSLTRETGENVGTYAINQGSLALSNNYALTYQGASLSITPLAVTVTADAKQKYCGQADPALTFASSPAVGSPLANGAKISFTGSLSRALGESVGTYAIGQGSLANNNYKITYVPANFNILGISVDASASSKPVAIGSQAMLSATVTGGAAGVGAVPVTFTVTDEANKVVFTKTISTDGSGIATETVPSSALALGVYKVEVVAGTACASSTAYIPVFDASGSFVTGGGWIETPAGAMPANPEAIGKANFGFVSKYKKGSSQVDGNTEFQFSAGNVNFKSTMHESGSLVIAAGKATYRGTGTVNGVTGFKFTIVAIDGDWKGGTAPDKFRIKIVDGRGQIVYDNQIGKDENSNDATILGNNGTGGGSIVIHEAKELTASNGKKVEAAAQLEGLSSARFDNYPNAFADQTTIRFAFDTEESFALEVYDIRGALVKKVATGKAEAGKVYEYELDARNLAEGVYFAKLATGSKVQTIKMLLKK